MCCVRRRQRPRDQGVASRPGRGSNREDAKTLPARDPLSAVVRELGRGLDGATLGALVIDDDRGPGVELVPHLPDFGGERDVLGAVVRPRAGHQRFDDPVQGCIMRPQGG
jgi:hypothetical protein